VQVEAHAPVSQRLTQRRALDCDQRVRVQGGQPQRIPSRRAGAGPSDTLLAGRARAFPYPPAEIVTTGAPSLPPVSNRVKSSIKDENNPLDGMSRLSIQNQYP